MAASNDFPFLDPEPEPDGLGASALEDDEDDDYDELADERSWRGGGRAVMPRWLAAVLITLAVMVLATLVAGRIGTDVLWYRALGFSRVLLTQWAARVALFALGFTAMAGAIRLAMKWAYSGRPTHRVGVDPDTLEPYRQALEPLRRAAGIIAPLLLGLFAGLAAAAHYETILLALYQVPFGARDPQFGRDIGFYVFALPALRAISGFALTVTIAALLAAAITHYLYGGLTLLGRGPERHHATRAARVQLAGLAALAMVLVAVKVWLDRYAVLTAIGEKFDGANYVGVHALIPARTILAVIALLVAAAFAYAAYSGNWRPPLIGTGLLLVSAIAIGGIYPAVLQRFQVNPNAQELERPFIGRNIAATLAAFGLTDVEKQQYDAVTTGEPGALRQDAETTASIRLLDPQIVSPSFRQLQQNKQYYNFADVLSVDRYEIDGEVSDTVIAVRELDRDGLGSGQRNWVNDHTVFTHGYGVVAAFGNQTGTDGRPAFFEFGIPPTGALSDAQQYEPRIYFSPAENEYSVVGAPPGTTPWELDYQTDDGAGGGQVNYTFPTRTVTAGPSIGSWWKKLLFAIKFGDEQLLFSDRVTSDSQILYDRDPRVRVQKVAPWLTLDKRVYPAVIDGRVKWIIDGYTTSSAYPYSESTLLTEPKVEGATAVPTLALEIPKRLNYIRNSVKATVDAYDGSVTLYAWEPSDPLLQAWSRIYAGSVQPMQSIPASLMSHVRYPEDLFKVQRTLLQRYHVTDPDEFFSGQDFWRIPLDPTIAADAPRTLQPPYYLTLKMPGQSEPTFSLSSLYVPGGNSDREILTGFLAVDSDAGSVAGERSEDYGQLRLLAMPRDNTVPGPGQVQTNFNTSPLISTQLNVLEIGSSEVMRGNQLTLPVGGGLLYVQPVYIQSATGTQFPLLRKVLVSFGDSIGFADDLETALDQVFGGDSGADVGDASPNDLAERGWLPPDGQGATQPGAVAVPDGERLSGPIGGEASLRGELTDALRQAQEAFDDGREALAKGDFAAYGEAQERLRYALELANAAEAALPR